ncbi:MAG: DUF6069 family protein [Lapillicoccus sp.]
MLSTEQLVSSTVAVRRGSLLTGVAAAVTLAVFAGLRLCGEGLVVAARGTEQPVPVGAVVVSTLLAGVAAYLLARLSLRTTRPRRTFVAVALAGLAVSAVAPAQAATTVSTAVWLMVLHVVVAAVLVPGLARALPATFGGRSLA